MRNISIYNISVFLSANISKISFCVRPTNKAVKLILNFVSKLCKYSNVDPIKIKFVKTQILNFLLSYLRTLKFNKCFNFYNYINIEISLQANKFTIFIQKFKKFILLKNFSRYTIDNKKVISLDINL